MLSGQFTMRSQISSPLILITAEVNSLLLLSFTGPPPNKSGIVNSASLCPYLHVSVCKGYVLFNCGGDN